jgi:hypothetical protein
MSVRLSGFCLGAGLLLTTGTTWAYNNLPAGRTTFYGCMVADWRGNSTNPTNPATEIICAYDDDKDGGYVCKIKPTPGETDVIVSGCQDNNGLAVDSDGQGTEYDIIVRH